MDKQLNNSLESDTQNRIAIIPNQISVSDKLPDILGGKLIPANGSFHCFITLPRAQQLPYNLQDCCRTVSVSEPDLDKIIIAKLISCGMLSSDMAFR